MASRFKAMDDTRSTLYGSIASFDSDSMLLDRSPVNSGFLMSVMVDARGGAMKGWHSGVRIIVPPGRVAMPTRVTCKLVKKEKLHHPPPLMEGEALASRLLQMGPTGARFLGPVIIEVPHYASLREGQREIVVLRSDGKIWQEHVVAIPERGVIESLNGTFDGEVIETLDVLYKKRVTRILTHDFPRYFALVSRVRQDTMIIGPESGVLTSALTQTKAQVPEGALTKTIKIGIQVLPIPSEVVTKLMGKHVAVSPIVTIEPRRRKFHKPVTLTMPMPKSAADMKIDTGEPHTMRLLCSITGGIDQAQWLDITEPTRLSVANNCVTFTTNVSGRFWLVDCQSIPKAAKAAKELYKQAIIVPYMAKYVVYAKRHEDREGEVRVYCMTDDKLDRTLESQERFTEVGRSQEFEVLEGKRLYMSVTDDLIPVKLEKEDMYIDFYAFCENRLALTVRVENSRHATGGLQFNTQRNADTGQSKQNPVEDINFTLPEKVVYKPVVVQHQRETVHDYKITYNTPPPPRKKVEPKVVPKLELPPPPPPKPPTPPPPLTDFTIEEEPISRAELRLTDIADTLHGDWVWLAGQLGLDFDEIIKIQDDYTYISERTLVMLHKWIEKKGEDATGNELERALRTIGREDVINKCMYNIEEVIDDDEKVVAKEHIEMAGMAGDSPIRSPHSPRSMSLDVSFDEAEFKQMAEKEQMAAMSNGTAGGRVPGWRHTTNRTLNENDSGGEYQDAESGELRGSLQKVIDDFMEGSGSPKTNRHVITHTTNIKSTTSPKPNRQIGTRVTSFEVTKTDSPRTSRQTTPYFKSAAETSITSTKSSHRNKPYLNTLDGIGSASPKSRRQNSPYFNTMSSNGATSPKSSIHNKSYVAVRTTTWTNAK